MTTTAIEAGTDVQDIRQRTRKGVILGPADDLAGRQMVKVKWDDGGVQTIPVDRLERYRVKCDVRSLLLDGSFGGIEDFLRNFTHRKLLNPVDDTLYSLHASRTKLLPHQFKPLIKFLDSVHRRYLIADEVGLGKTIEAGIIMSELRARRQLRNALIFCPNHLRTKWASEMLNRFDERFKIVSSRKEWRDLVETSNEQGIAESRLIVGHKTLGSRAVLEQLTEGAPGFDLVIVDEAHHFKNSESIGRRVLGEIADSAHQLLLLTATPLQTDSNNLLSLLRLLDEPGFRDRALFEDRLRTNARIVRSERILRAAQHTPISLRVAMQSAMQELSQVRDIADRRFGLDVTGTIEDIKSRIATNQHEPAVTDVVALTSRLRELNLLAPYITRTRKVEVQQSCKRHVESVRPPSLTAAEQHFYRSAVEWFRSEVAERYGDSSVLFLSRTFERRLSSSFHGFGRFLLSGAFNKQAAILGNPPTRVFDAARSLGDTDSKFDELRRLLDRIRDENPHEKVIVFASFRATLAYLSRRLAECGWEHEVIHGGVPMVPGDAVKDERGRRVHRFLHDPNCRLLLSSNVGGEGLDLQRASVVVNYDLPWNPATLEQRIGRIDRFGQRAEIIRVLNLILPGTVEDVIFTRVYDRLQLFESAIGDCAEILGGILKALSAEFLRREMNEQDLDEQARLASIRIEQTRRDTGEILERERELIAFDDDFADQLRSLDRHANTVKPSDLQRLIDGILQERFRRSWLRPSGLGSTTSEASQVFDLYVDPDLKQRIQASLAGARDSGVIWRFIRAVNEREVVRVTFDGETAEADDDLILLTSRHPVLQMLVRSESDPAQFHPVSAVKMPALQDLSPQPGLLVLIDGQFSLGEQQRRYLMPIWIVAGTTAEPPLARQVLRCVLDHAKSAVPRSVPSGNELGCWLDSAENVAEAELLKIMRRILAQEEARIRPRVTEMKERYNRRISKAALRVFELEHAFSDNDGHHKRLRNARNYHRRLTREKDERLQRLTRLPEPSSEFQTVGAVWIEFP